MVRRVGDHRQRCRQEWCEREEGEGVWLLPLVVVGQWSGGHGECDALHLLRGGDQLVGGMKPEVREIKGTSENERF